MSEKPFRLNKEIAIQVAEVSPAGERKFVVCADAVKGEALDDIEIRILNGHSVSLKQLLKDLGEI